MDLQEITSLITIRNHVVNSINNYALTRDTVSKLNEMLILLDRRIVDKLLDQDFKDFLGFEDAKKFVQEARENNNIRSGLKSSRER
jgi:hypothetical protein